MYIYNIIKLYIFANSKQIRESYYHISVVGFVLLVVHWEEDDEDEVSWRWARLGIWPNCPLNCIVGNILVYFCVKCTQRFIRTSILFVLIMLLKNNCVNDTFLQLVALLPEDLIKNETVRRQEFFSQGTYIANIFPIDRVSNSFTFSSENCFINKIISQCDFDRRYLFLESSRKSFFKQSYEWIQIIKVLQ